MSVSIISNIMEVVKIMSKATEKIKNGLGEITDAYGKAVKQAVADALVSFCEQNEEFDRAIEQSDKKMKDCIAAVVKDVKGSISDIEAYRRAVSFWFPGATVDMVMTIRMSEYDKPQGGDIELSLFDFLE